MEELVEDEKQHDVIDDDDVEDDGDDLFLNSCGRCGETWLLPLDFGEEFDCMDAGKPCGPQAAQAALASFELDFRGGPGGAAASEGRPPPAPVRSQLLCQILAKSLGAFEAADLMTRHGFEPPREGELAALEAELRAKRTERARALRAQARSTEGDHRKKSQRYLDGKLVDVAKGAAITCSRRCGPSDLQEGVHQHEVPCGA